MENSKKLTALQKAYADIILNTAKEAAARIMASERKALRFRRELSTTKEEALRMLLRLKQMMDTKVNEAEMVSLSQQRKIEELEAQLEEAEEIVRELRSELRVVQDELDKFMKGKAKSMDERSRMANTAPRENFPQLRTLDISGPGFSRTGSQLERLTAHKTYDFDMKKNCLYKPDFPSILLRRKDPRLYRNGCTQRIHALGRILLDGKAFESVPGDETKSVKRKERDQEGKRLPEKAMSKLANMSGNNLPKVVQVDRSNVQGLVLNSFSKKRKQPDTCTKTIAPSTVYLARKFLELSLGPDLSCSESPSVDNSKSSEKNVLEVNKDDVQKDLSSTLAPKVPTENNQKTVASGGPSVTETDPPVLQGCCALNITKSEKEVFDKSDLTSQERLSMENLKIPGCKTDVEIAKESVVISSVKDSDLNDDIPIQPINNRFLFTFQRKRKKESLGSPDGGSSLDESTMDKKISEQDTSPSESNNLKAESSRESRRLAQVARQLISLSEKKWWQ